MRSEHAAALAALRGRGFAVLLGLAGGKELARWRRAFDRLMARALGASTRRGADERLRRHGHWTFPNPQQRARAFAATDYPVRVRRLLEELLDAPAALRETYAIYKPPHHGAATPWHQDEAYLAERPPFELVSVWLPLQDVNMESGCLSFIPGTHRGPLLAHHVHTRGDTTPVATLLTQPKPRALARAVPCPLRAGDAAVHLLRTLHAASTNVSPHPRRAWVLDFAVPRRALSQA